MSDIGHKLHRETEAAKALRANLADIIGDDEQCAADMVEAETNLPEAIDAAVRMLVEDKISLAGLESMISILDSRRQRIESRMGNTKTALMAALEQSGKKSFDHPAVKLSIRPTPPCVIVTDEAMIRGPYWRPSDPKLDKRAVLAALKAGETVEGATLSNGGTCIALSWS
jgi:hypothetical protein